MGLPFQNSKCFWLGFKTWYFHSFHLCFKWITFEGIIFHVAERACLKAIQQPHSGLLQFSVAPVVSGPSLALDILVAGNIYMYFLFWPLLTQAVILGKKTFLHVDFSFCLSCFCCSSCLHQWAQSHISKETDKLSSAARRSVFLCVLCPPSLITNRLTF